MTQTLRRVSGVVPAMLGSGLLGTTININVIIIRAGLTRLSLDCQLVRCGGGFIADEKNEGVTPYSEAQTSSYLYFGPD